MFRCLLFSMLMALSFAVEAETITIAGRAIPVTNNTRIMSAYAQAGKFSTFFINELTRYQVPANKGCLFLAARVINTGGSSGEFALGNASNVVDNTSAAANLGTYKEPLLSVQDYIGYFPGGTNLQHDFLLRYYVADGTGSPSPKYPFLGCFESACHVTLVCEEVDL